MPVNFQEVQRQIREMGHQAPQREAHLRSLREQSHQLLTQYADETDALRARVQQATALSSGLRCALPTHEALTCAVPAPALPPNVVLLAVDGSQINPNRHDPLEFGLINLGAIRIVPGAAQAPREMVQSQLLVYDDLRTTSGPMTEEMVALQRDLSERKMLANLARQETADIVTLTDGPLELFREPRDMPAFQRAFDEYLEVLRELGSLNAVTAGYVDRPHSDLVVRLLELMTLLPTELSEAGHKRPLGGVRDIDLFREYLQPGDRSAVFAIQSNTAAKFDGALALHFFYLNVGTANRAHLARVEAPAWVMQQPALLNLLHAALVSQSRQLGSRPYPYALHRAHEVAVVTFQEKDQILDMIQKELLRQGLPPGDYSNKQGNKDLAPRARYGK